MEKRVILFLLFSLIILIGYEYFLRVMGWEPQQGPVGERPLVPSGAAPAPQAPTVQQRTPSQASAQPASPIPATENEELVEVVTDLYRATISNRGGVIRRWELARYRLTNEHDSPAVQLVHPRGTFAAPLTLETRNTTLTRLLNDALYRVERDFTRLDNVHPTGHLTLTYESPAGPSGSPLRVQKQLTFHRDSYVVDVAISTEGIPGPLTTWLGTNFGIVEWSDGLIGLIGPASRVNDIVQKGLPESEQELTGVIGWVALQDKYFLSVMIPTGASAALVRKEGDKLASVRVQFPSPTLASFRLYAGPKAYETLKTLGVGLEDTIDFGWFIFGSWSVVKLVAKPLFAVLQFLHSYTHNYGLAIVLLTVCVKLLFAPLQYKSYKSMKQLQLLQPKVLALQNKYKDDRDRLNRELIKLYREHKVNPVGGCLPMLLQIPVFVALFNVLYMTIELRQAPFILWITDLSVPDPYYVLPILMGITMVIQQKITPTTMDPTQAKIMLLLPAFMTLLFVNFASGLVLYWLTNNLLTIIQQVITDRYIFRPPLVATSPSQTGP